MSEVKVTLRRPLSLLNFNHWWFRIRTCRNVFSCWIYTTCGT